MTSSLTTKKNSSGFTFMEALVVAVIMGILAAVCIPIYTGYVNNQRQQAAQSLAQLAATAANTYYRRNNADPANAAQLNLFLPNPAQFQITINPPNVKVDELSRPSPLVSVTIPYRTGP
jgi:type II secretory pathway pseudopilin PulG